MTAAGPPTRRSLLAVEITALVVTSVLDVVLLLGTGTESGLAGTVLVTVVPPLGTAIAVLTVVRRRFPRRIGLLGGVVVGFSLLSTGTHVVAGLAGVGSDPPPVLTEILAVVLFAGAGCRRLPPARAALLAVGAGVAVVIAPVLRFGFGSGWALLAAPAALAWGVALAVGLVLRDADNRHRAVLDRARTNERLQLARELHDLVAHYVSGIVVRAQAARALAGNPAVPAQDPAQVYREIEEAGAEALAAMRKLVGMLRDGEQAVPLPDEGVGEIIRSATANRATVEVAADVEDLRVPAEVAATIHRVVMESLTNVRRHAPNAKDVQVTISLTENDLRLDISNDDVSPRAGAAGYGIIGMTERVSALGGTLEAAVRDRRWHTTARLPLDPPPMGV